MTKVVDNIHLPTKVNIFKVQDEETGDVVGVCTEVERKLTAAPAAPRGLERSPTTCCPRYPPGSTVLECRLEGDQPVAYVVQVPADGNTTTQEMCLLVEAKQSPSGPLSRVISRPQEDPKRLKQSNPACQSRTSRRPTAPAMTYCLESCECPQGPVAVASEMPMGHANIITTLETTKGACEGPTSKIVYSPTTTETNQTTSCDSPVTLIDCTATAKGTSARITRCSSDNANPLTRNCLETYVPRDGGCPAATSFQCRSKNSNSVQQDILETRVDECGPRTCMIGCPQGRRKYCMYMESRSSCDGSFARIKQEPCASITEEEISARKMKKEAFEAYRLPPDCAESCSSAKDHQRKHHVVCEDTVPLTPKVERRNGLDPSEDRVGRFERGPRRHVCPPRCCPMQRRPQFKLEPNSFGNQRRHEECTRPQVESICPSQAAQEKLKLTRQSETKGSDCTKPKTSVRVEILESERALCEKIQGGFNDHMPRVASRELLTRYRDYVSANQLDRYEACRSKRNGLQNECVLLVPRAVIELKRKEVACRKSDVGLSRSDARDGDRLGVEQTLAAPPGSLASLVLEDTKKLPESICV